MARAWEQLRDIEPGGSTSCDGSPSWPAGAADAVHRRSVATLTPPEVIGLAGPGGRAFVAASVRSVP